jgi:LytS/YehU family sensor histidine kinase
MPLRVEVSIMLDDGLLSIDVSNTGKMLTNAEGDGKQEEAHGTSLENLKQRLELMFKDQYGFQLYEDNGWVHAKIRINYEPGRNGRKPKPFENKFSGSKAQAA